MEGAGAHFHVVGLQHDAAVRAPELLQGQDEILEGRARLSGGAGLAAAALVAFSEAVLVGIGVVLANHAEICAHYTHFGPRVTPGGVPRFPPQLRGAAAHAP